VCAPASASAPAAADRLRQIGPSDYLKLMPEFSTTASAASNPSRAGSSRSMELLLRLAKYRDDSGSGGAAMSAQLRRLGPPQFTSEIRPTGRPGGPSLPVILFVSCGSVRGIGRLLAMMGAGAAVRSNCAVNNGSNAMGGIFLRKRKGGDAAVIFAARVRQVPVTKRAESGRITKRSARRPRASAACRY